MQLAQRIVVICTLQLSGMAHAAEWKIDPTVVFRAGYNDNLRLATDNEVSTAEASFNPSTVFSVETPKSGASGSIDFNFRRYEDDSNLDDNNSRFAIKSFHNLERSRLGLDLNFIKDTTLDSQLEATGIAFDRVRRQSWSVSPNWLYSLNERTNATASYSYREVEYKNAGDTGFVDFDLNSAQASLFHIFNEKTTASLTLSRTKSDNDNDVESTNTGFQGGASFQISETLSASLFVGIRRTEVDFSETSLIPIFSGNTIIGFLPQAQDETNSDWGSTYSASINKAFLRGDIGLFASRDISNDINGRPIEVTRIRASTLYRLTEVLSASLDLEFFDSETNNDISNGTSRNYYQIRPSFSWKFKRFWSLSGNYRYRKQTFDDDSSDATQNAAYLTLTYHWPRIAISR